MWNEDDDDDGRGEVTKKTQAFHAEVKRDAFTAFDHLYRLVRKTEQRSEDTAGKLNDMVIANARFQGGVRLLGAIALATVGTLSALASWVVVKVIEHDRVNAEHEIRIDALTHSVEDETGVMSAVRNQQSQQEATMRELRTILEGMDARTQRIEQHLDRRPR